jgi:hypothetical protein
VIAAILATLLAIHIGFTAVVAIAAALYLAAPLALRGQASPAADEALPSSSPAG